jgi:hypothetical protein
MQLFKLTFFGLLLGTSLAASAQDDEKPNYYKRPENTAQPTVTDTAAKKKITAPSDFSYTKKKFDIKKLFIEPTNFQLNFGTNYFLFGFNPLAAYQVTKKPLYIGLSLNYNIQVYSNQVVLPNGSKPTITSQVYGGGPVVHYRIWKGFFARLRPEVLGWRYPTGNVNLLTNKIEYKTSVSYHAWLGAGYSLNIKGLISIPFAIYVDPLYFAQKRNAFSPYPSPILLQIGIYSLSPSIKL